jgi:hypothetical protein
MIQSCSLRRPRRRIYPKLLSAPSSAQNFLKQRRRERRLEHTTCSLRRPRCRIYQENAAGESAQQGTAAGTGKI